MKSLLRTMVIGVGVMGGAAAQQADTNYGELRTHDLAASSARCFVQGAEANYTCPTRETITVQCDAQGGCPTTHEFETRGRFGQSQSVTC